MFQTDVKDITKTYFTLNSLFPENRAALLDNVKKYGRACQARDDDMAHALCLPDNQCYRRTLKICNI